MNIRSFVDGCFCVCRQCVLTDKIACTNSAVKLSKPREVFVQREVLELLVVLRFDVLKDLVEVCADLISGARFRKKYVRKGVYVSVHSCE